METLERTSRVAEQFARATGDSYETVLDHFVALQERNVAFLRGVYEDVVRESREQAEGNRALARELAGKAEQQREAARTLVGESVDAYLDLVYAPFSYDVGRGLGLVEGAVEEVTFPIPGYDELNVEEVRARLDGLSAAQIREVREYEKRNKNRETLIEQLDRRLKAASA